MTITLLEFEDNNMAGYVWKWSFFLNRTANGKEIELLVLVFTPAIN